MLVEDNMDLKVVDYVQVFFDWDDQEIFFNFNFSEYTTKKILLMYGISTPTGHSLSSNNKDMNDIRWSIPQCYFVGNVYILPFHEYQKLYSFIQQEIVDFLIWDNVDAIIAVAKSNKESVDKLYDYITNIHQSTINSLNERKKLG